MDHVPQPRSGGLRAQPVTTTRSCPRGPTSACRCDVESWACPGGDILVVRVSGELDLVTRPFVAGALAEAVCRAPRHLVVDLGALAFCCARGFDLFAETAFVARAQGTGFALSGLSAHQNRIATLILAPPGLARYRSVAAAVCSLRAGHTTTAPSVNPGACTV